MTPSIDDIRRDDRLLDALGRREPAPQDPVTGLLSAWTAEVDSSLTAAPARSRRSRGRSVGRGLVGGGAAALLALGSSVAAAVTGTHVPVLSDAGDQLVRMVGWETLLENEVAAAGPGPVEPDPADLPVGVTPGDRASVTVDQDGTGPDVAAPFEGGMTVGLRGLQLSTDAGLDVEAEVADPVAERVEPPEPADPVATPPTVSRTPPPPAPPPAATAPPVQQPTTPPSPLTPKRPPVTPPGPPVIPPAPPETPPGPPESPPGPPVTPPGPPEVPPVTPPGPPVTPPGPPETPPGPPVTPPGPPVTPPGPPVTPPGPPVTPPGPPVTPPGPPVTPPGPPVTPPGPPEMPPGPPETPPGPSPRLP